MKRFVERLKTFLSRNLQFLLALYILVILLQLKNLYTVATAVLLLLFVIICTLRWQIKGGITSSIIATVIISIAHIFREESTIRGVVIGSLSYFIVGIGIGRMISYMGRQREQYQLLYEEFKRYFDLVQVIIVALDRDSRVTFINRKGCEILGYKEDEIIGKDWFSNFLPKDRRERVRQVFKDLIDGKIEPIEYYENPILTKDNRERTISWHNSVLRDSKGAIIGTLSAGEDITELKRTEEELQERLTHLNTLYRVADQLLMEDLDIYKRAKTALKICVEELGVDFGWIGYAEPKGKVRLVAQYPEEHPYTKGLNIRWDDTPFGQGPTGRAIRTGKPQITEDTLINNTFEPWREKALQFGFRTTGAFPLIARDSIFGALNLYSSQPNFFTPERIELVQNLTHIVALALESARLFGETQERIRKIQALHNIDIAIAGSMDVRVILNVALDEVLRQLNVDAADVFLYSPYSQSLEYTAQKGFRTELFKAMSIRLGEGIAGRIALERRSIKILNLAEEKSWIRKSIINEEGFVSYYGVPLIAKGQLLGVLEVFKRTPMEEDEEWEEYLETLAGQIAIALDNARLLESLERANRELFEAYDKTLEGWAYALDLRDRETEGHSQRVTELTVRIAKEMGVKDEELVHIRRGALLHDIGKMGIPDSILLKPDKLTDEEWEIMKKHPVYAYQMLSRIEYLRPALDIPYCHHEKWDGTGYSRGLKGEEIPLPARIFAVADVFDALTSDRPYRKAWTKESAIEYIKNESGKHFDPRVIEAFLKVIEEG